MTTFSTKVALVSPEITVLDLAFCHCPPPLPLTLKLKFWLLKVTLWDRCLPMWWVGVHIRTINFRVLNVSVKHFLNWFRRLMLKLHVVVLLSQVQKMCGKNWEKLNITQVVLWALQNNWANSFLLNNFRRIAAFHWVLTQCVFISPGLAWIVIPRTWSHFSLGFLDFQSWRLFVALCSIPSIVSALIFKFFMPESPKFLMEV